MAVTGHVSLVGAGPGDPGLLTRRAIARLRAADLVLYDALIDERILRYARKAQRFFVGKRAGRHAMTQDAIHRLLIRGARRGKHVVRLKGGDPFVFGRGGEEALAPCSALAFPTTSCPAFRALSPHRRRRVFPSRIAVFRPPFSSCRRTTKRRSRRRRWEYRRIESPWWC